MSILIVALFYSCAEMHAPPGGKEDKYAPQLLGSIPENGALSVPAGNEITLFFTESVSRPSSGRAIYISPRPVEEPRIKWKSDRVMITLPDSFQTDQTYIVSVSTAITDLRRNRLDSALTIAFSTGTSLDSGVVAGHVYNQLKPASGAVVALYDPAALTDSMLFDSVWPEYVTSSGPDGNFSLKYLPDRQFHLVAFVDKNNNELFNPRKESFALPDREIVVGASRSIDQLMMGMTSHDTTRVGILSATYTTDRLLKIRFSRKTDLRTISSNPALIGLRSTSDTSLQFYATAVRETSIQPQQIVHAWIGEVPPGEYDLAVIYDSEKAPAFYQGMTVRSVEDKTSPSVLSFLPGEKPQFVQDIMIELLLSESIDVSMLNDQTFSLWADQEQQVAMTYKFSDTFRLQIEPAELTPGVSYDLKVTEFDIVDMTGNTLGDSLRSYGFSILDVDSLGSISGTIQVNLPGRADDPVVLSLKKTDNNQEFDLQVTGNAFTRELPAGKYVLSGFIDSDSSGTRGLGGIYPFNLAETKALYPDTINVRARFETAGVLFQFD